MQNSENLPTKASPSALFQLRMFMIVDIFKDTALFTGILWAYITEVLQWIPLNI